MEEFVIVAWPEIQDLMDKEGFNENAFPVLDEKGIEKFGDQSYFVNKNWMLYGNNN